MAIEMEKGSVSIDAQNIMPVIKRWLYSDKDIFLREVVSNGCDAITKYRMTNPDDESEMSVMVTVDKENKTLTISDTGIGMTEDEVKRYINQVAFSGASEFMKKFEGDEKKGDIIGHFGLGFYSVFMVSENVEIETLSCQEGAEPVHWESKDGMDFAISEGHRTAHGTSIILHISDEEKEFLELYRVREVLTRYCGYMAYPIYLMDANAKPVEREEEIPGETNEDGTPKKRKVVDEPKPSLINDTKPLWLKKPSECEDKEYIDFYHKMFGWEDPLFWVHLNVDYPFNLKGILYFPKLRNDFGKYEGQVKLFAGQVFVADNVKEVIPEFLMLLKGVIDCPDLPLNVSRSALQNDGFVKKISEYITKKVADKLIGMCKTDKENYEKYWDDISPFIKFGCLKDTKFCDKMNDYILFKNLDDKYLTLPELLVKEEEKKDENKDEAEVLDADGNPIKKESTDAADENTEEKDERKVIYYVTDKLQQGQYIKMFKEQNMDAVILDHNIDTSFISQLEQRNEHYKFMRIDADVTESLKDETSAEDLKAETDTLTDVFKKALNNDKLTVKVEKLKNADIASVITLSEEGRRMQDMMKMYAMNGMGGMDPNMFAADQTLTLNANNELVKYIFEHKDSEHVPMFCEQLYDLAMLSNQPLSVDAMAKFVQRSNQIMMLLAK